MKALIISIICLATAFVARAGENVGDSLVLRPVTASYTLRAGSSHLRDTYLTPLAYSGWTMGLDYERFQAMKHDPERWIMRLQASVSGGATENPSRTSTMWDIEFSPSWAMMCRWRPQPGLTMAVGGIARANIGALYLSHNSNNPVSAKAALTVGATAMATYSFTLGRLPVTLRYQPSLSLIGAFFAPEYDQLYYEIYLGNRGGVCRVATPVNYRDLENLLTADLRLGNTNLRVGYRNRVFSTKACDIVSRRVEHAFVIGITTEWISLSAGSRRTPDARLISSFY